MTNIKQQYQVTLICKTGAYKPVSCIIEVEQKQGIDLTKDKVMKRGIIKLGVNLEQFGENPINERGYINVELKKSKSGEYYVSLQEEPVQRKE